MISDPYAALVHSHADDLHRDAAGARLARMATCCQPSALSALVGRLRRSSAQECTA